MDIQSFSEIVDFEDTGKQLSLIYHPEESVCIKTIWHEWLVGQKNREKRDTI